MATLKMIMREIKFRAKRIDNGEWINGLVLFKYDKSEAIIVKLTATELFCDNVIPDTIGQFTGLHDKTGKEIYEGDIVAIAGVIKGYVRYNARYWRYEIATADEPLENERIPSGRPEECWMVIGNIHDSPELLKTE